MAESLLDLDDVIELLIDLPSEFFNEGFAEFEDKESCLHVFPRNVEMRWLNRHALVQLLHDWSLVVVGASKDMGEELDHGAVQFGDVRYVLQEEVVDAVVIEDELVKLRHYLLQLVMSSYLLKQRHLIFNKSVTIYWDNSPSISINSAPTSPYPPPSSALQ